MSDSTLRNYKIYSQEYESQKKKHLESGSPFPFTPKAEVIYYGVFTIKRIDNLSDSELDEMIKKEDMSFKVLVSTVAFTLGFLILLLNLVM